MTDSDVTREIRAVTEPVRATARLVVDDQMARHPSFFQSSASLIARAWIDQIVTDANEWAVSGDDERRRNVAAARYLAGEYADDIVLSSPGQQPMYHRLGFSDKQVVSVAMMLPMCMPLWMHYYGFVRDVADSFAQSSKAA